ncbi:MAG: thiamine diphosphokinase [Chloroflexi bacterium]|nr:MAG: thiamine diphosphokinase [Chloroflexota bacterium]
MSTAPLPAPLPAQPQKERAWIFANGEQIHLEAVRELIQPGDFLVAADGGLHHLRRLGLAPGLVIGDLDSLELAVIEQLKREGARVEQHPTHKDETDLELAVGAVLQAGYATVLIAGALGGRLDMTLANIFLLGLPELNGVDIRLEDGMEEVFLIRPAPLGGNEGRLIEGRPGDRVSLLPLGGPARGIFTSGLEYPLHGETLYPERTRGISNVQVSGHARVSLEEGILICIHTRSAYG